MGDLVIQGFNCGPCYQQQLCCSIKKSGGMTETETEGQRDRDRGTGTERDRETDIKATE